MKTTNYFAHFLVSCTFHYPHFFAEKYKRAKKEQSIIREALGSQNVVNIDNCFVYYKAW
jgi:FMN-dependent NADH-azoreductase